MYQADEWEFQVTPTPSASFSQQSQANQGKIVLLQGKAKLFVSAKALHRRELPQLLFASRKQPLRSYTVSTQGHHHRDISRANLLARKPRTCNADPARPS